MAQVSNIRTARERIDRYLDNLFREWNSVPELAHEWEESEELDRLDFVIEWPIREDRLGQLAQWAAEGLLTPVQRARYDELLRLVARNRPIMDELLAE